VPSDRAPLACPSCGVDLDGSLASRSVPAAGEHGPKDVLVVWCRACGHVLCASPT
jgi:hypothetical protein